MAILELIQDDVGVIITFTLQDASGTAVNLTGNSEIKFKVLPEAGGTLQIDGTCSVSGVATGGIVTYTTVAADLDTTGKYKGEIQATYTGGKVWTWKLDGVHILGDLD